MLELLRTVSTRSSNTVILVLLINTPSIFMLLRKKTLKFVQHYSERINRP
jgi:hypothetical protein